MTRIPIKADVGFDEEFHKSIVYFPLVGFETFNSIFLSFANPQAIAMPIFPAPIIDILMLL